VLTWHGATKRARVAARVAFAFGHQVLYVCVSSAAKIALRTSWSGRVRVDRNLPMERLKAPFASFGTAKSSGEVRP
jgi:hypothetical protein